MCKIELVARPSHDPHADSHVGRVRQLNAVLGEGTAHWAHAEGYQVHCAPWNKNPPQEFSALIIFLLKTLRNIYVAVWAKAQLNSVTNFGPTGLYIMTMHPSPGLTNCLRLYSPPNNCFQWVLNNAIF